MLSILMKTKRVLGLGDVLLTRGGEEVEKEEGGGRAHSNNKEGIVEGTRRMGSRGLSLTLTLVFKLLVTSGFFLHANSTAMAPNAHNFTPMPAAEEAAAGQLELLKREEARLAEMLSSVRRQKLSVLR